MNKKITSNIIKLIKHENICNGVFTPISSQIVLTDRCNLNCSFCTAGGKNRKDKDVLSKKAIFKALDDLKSLGCKGIEYTGGGEPTLHKDFKEIIEKTHNMGLDIGLVTNGTRIKHLSNRVDWSCFDWIRVSVNAGPDNYQSVHGADLFDTVLSGLSVLSEKLPKKFGVSYIYSEQPLEDIDALFKEIINRAPNMGYIRVGLDIKKYKINSPGILSVFNDKVASFSEESGIFVDVQTERDITIPKKCYMGKVKPCINADGSVYSCCISQHRRFGRLCGVSEYKEHILNGSLLEIDTKICPYCIYRQLNDFMEEIDTSDIKNKNFI